MKKNMTWILIVVMLAQLISPIVFADINVDIPVPEFRSAVLDITEMNVIEGVENGVELLSRVQYEDISDNPFEKSIVRMATQGIASRQGESNFNPDVEITGFEAMKYLVRLAGQEAAVQQAVLPLTGGLSQGAIDALYNEQYAAQALAQGTLLATEYTNMNSPTTREQLAMWVARTAGLAPVFQDVDAVFGFNDYALVTPENRGLIESLIRSEIMTSGNDGNFDPRGTMTRGEFMEVVDAAAESLFAQNGITVGYGLVTGVQPNTTQEVGYSIEGRTLIVRNIDGSATGIKSSVNSSTNQKVDYVVYKDGIQTESRSILLGDEIQYFVQNDRVFYAEVIDDNTIIEKLRISDEQEGNFTTYFGSIYEILQQKHWQNDRYIDSKRYRVRTFDGQTFDLVVETDVYTGITNDMIVYKGQQIGGMSLIEVGDDVSFVVKNNDDVVYVSAIPLWKTELSGTVRYVTTDETTGDSTITVFGYDDIIYEYPVASYANVTVNDSFGTLEDLRYGQDVSLDLNQGYVVKIDSETFIDKPGYIPKYGKMRMGNIFAIYPAGIVFDIGGEKITYTIPTGVPITKGGIAVTKNALKEGDSVKLFFDDIYSDDISKMEVEGIERLIQKVYKGKLGSVNEKKQMITLYEPRYLKNEDWESVDGYTKDFTLSNEAEICLGNLEVNLDNLERDHKDDTVYVVVEDSYGETVTSKVTIKSGGENIYSDNIRTLNDALGSMELDNRINMNITKGTIVLKEGRIVDPSLLAKRDNVLVVSESFLGESNANVVKLITRTENIFDRIYIGAIENVGGNFFTLRNWSTMNDNEWDDIDTSMTDSFYFYSDTVIKDITDDDKIKTIKPADFFHNSYARIENKSNDNKGLEYERYYAVMVLKDLDGASRSVVSMNMRHKGFLEGQNIDDDNDKLSEIKIELEDVIEDMFLTRGLVDEVDTSSYQRIKLTDSNDWFASVAEWRANSVDTYVEYKNSLIIKGNSEIDVTDIEQGDTIYVLRHNEKAQVIFVSED